MHWKKYPAGAYAYFLVRDIEKTRDAFMRGEITHPTFHYGKHFNTRHLSARLRSINRDLQKAVSDEEKEFYLRRREQTEFLLSAHHLQLATPDDTAALEAFREGAAKVYGKPEARIAASILHRIEQRAERTPEVENYWSYIKERVNYDAKDGLITPPKATFKRIREYFYQYATWLQKPDELHAHSPHQLIALALDYSGASSDGWRVSTSNDSAHARVNYKQKRVRVGKHYRPRSPWGSLQIAVHEVYGHVNRYRRAGEKIFHPWEAEGVAVMLEQLIPAHYTTKRTHRYLAIALGWGTLGQAMSFREVYEIIWRAMMIMGAGDEHDAKVRAFHECVRAFRGGRPDIPGAVFTKDLVYLKGNLRVWQYLEQITSYDHFIDLIEGRKEVV